MKHLLTVHKYVKSLIEEMLVVLVLNKHFVNILLQLFKQVFI